MFNFNGLLKNWLLLVWIGMGGSWHLFAQSVSSNYAPNWPSGSWQSLPEYSTAGLNKEMLRLQLAKPAPKPIDNRFGQLLSLRASLADGKWTDLPNGDRIWQIRLHSPGAKAVAVYFDSLKLAPNSQLSCFSPESSLQLGPVTAIANAAGGRFATPMVAGETLVLELFEPRADKGQNQVKVRGLGHAYRWNGGSYGLDKTQNFGEAGSCNVNVNCPEGSNWADQRDAVLRIQVLVDDTNSFFPPEIGWCTGAVVNNTNQDGRPFVLSAMHCGQSFFSQYYASASDFEQWVFYFNYQASGCSNPASEGALGLEFMTGGSLIAHSNDNGGETGSDFLLLELKERIPEELNPFFAGWSRSSILPTSGVGIHHPSGDIKKISTFPNPATLTSWISGNGVNNTHLRVRWTRTSNGFGVTEGGSSGSPIFDVNKLIVGTLTGGAASCANANDNDTNNDNDDYGFFFYHWDRNGTAPNRQLKPWLDPRGTGQTTLEGARYGTLVRNDRPGGDMQKPLQARVFPNPARNGTLVVEVADRNLARNARIEVYNTLGAKVEAQVKWVENTGRFEVSIPQQVAGLYFLKVTSGSYGFLDRIQIQP